jgi:2-polyprenyl-3-methyl-5-hydroxy-6-metoxy-1,4-benzoquinol methylase
MEQYKFGLDQTLAFIEQYLAIPSSKILEVGAGRGLLCKQLRELGSDVIAIDKSDKAIMLAREIGSQVVKGDICTYLHQDKFDGIVFCMSAHHVHPLADALDRCRTLLKPDGQLIMEEYAVEDADEASAQWFYSNAALIACITEDSLQDDLYHSVIEPLASWRQQHATNLNHHFNPGDLIVKEVTRNFEVIKVERVPYFYRYFAAKIGPILHSQMIAYRFYELEKKLIDASKIRPVGLRIVAKQRR